MVSEKRRCIVTFNRYRSKTETWKFRHTKNTSVLLKSARESRAYSTEERYCTDATVSHVIDS